MQTACFLQRGLCLGTLFHTFTSGPGNLLVYRIQERRTNCVSSCNQAKPKSALRNSPVSLHASAAQTTCCRHCNEGLRGAESRSFAQRKHCQRHQSLYMRLLLRPCAAVIAMKACVVRRAEALLSGSTARDEEVLPRRMALTVASLATVKLRTLACYPTVMRSLQRCLPPRQATTLTVILRADMTLLHTKDFTKASRMFKTVRLLIDLHTAAATCFGGKIPNSNSEGRQLFSHQLEQ